ncbi:hypothetical protein [Pelagibius sp. 7325]|uniref:hypothetical protein n=1 Tax=Pelagibius sp. 7325 TaxID=3131994 RepID=UPI0030EF6B09
MSPKVTKILIAAAVTVTVSLLAAAPADARDWRQSVQRHYSAAEQAKYTPKGDNPQWGFTLDNVVNDMAWRARTSSMLRSLPKPGIQADSVQPANQLADRPEPPRLRFSF